MPVAGTRWLVTGAAGFIGSHIAQRLLEMDQHVTALDDFSTGSQHNLDEVLAAVRPDQRERFRLIETDIRDRDACAAACLGVRFVLHQAALGSVARSVADPITTNAVNVKGFVNMLVGAREANVDRFVYASSGAVYGGEAQVPWREGHEGKPLSPYAVSKAVNELYAESFRASYGMSVVGLRYSNIYGPRQDPAGEYASVIPRWMAAMLAGEACVVNGDGETSRDFAYVGDVVSANLLAATAPESSIDGVYNVATGVATTLNDLHSALAAAVERARPGTQVRDKVHDAERPNDIRRSVASIERITEALGFQPRFDLERGLDLTVGWFAEH